MLSTRYLFLMLLLLTSVAFADRPGRSLGLKQYQIPVTWLERPSQQGPGDFARWLKQGALKRYYEVHVPPGYDPTTPSPAILMLHGGGGHPAALRWQANMEPTADKAGYILIYPAGTHPLFKDKVLHWNVGPERKARKLRRVDDVAFLERVLDDASTFFNIDPRRVYATGISNGAHMSYRMACESDRLAAIAPIAGVEQLGRYYQAPERGLPIIHFHGKKDTWNTYEGGMTTDKSGFEPRRLPAVWDHIQAWVEANGCRPNENRHKRVGQAERFVFDGGRDNSEVVFWLLHDGGHTWPGGRVSRAEQTGKLAGVKLGPPVGKLNRDISAGELMLEFFSRHSR